MIEQFEELLKKQLNGLPEYEINELVGHYREMYSDAIENGVDEAQAVKNLGNPITIAKNHRNQRSEWVGLTGISKTTFDQRPLIFVILFVIAIPFLIGLSGAVVGLSIALLSILFVVFAIGFVGVFVSAVAGFGLALGSLYWIVIGFVMMSNSFSAGLVFIGGGLVMAGLGTVCILFIKPLTRFGVRYSKWFINFIKTRIQAFINWVKMIFVGKNTRPSLGGEQ